MTVEPSDAGIDTVRAIADAIDAGDTTTAWALLGPRTRTAVGDRRNLSDLGAMLEPLVSDPSAPFDDVIVAATPKTSTHLVIVGDRRTREPVAAVVTRQEDQATAELSPPTASEVTIDVVDRQRIEIGTPDATDVALLVDGFHFRPTIRDGQPALMRIPYPLSADTHLLGAWYRTPDGADGVGLTIIPAAD